MTELPEVPEVPAEAWHARRQANLMPRYEDVAQDARVKPTALPPALGDTCWRAFFADPATAGTLRAKGVLPILRRLVVVAGDAPVSATVPFEAEGAWAFRTTSGERQRVLLDMRAEIRGRRGRTHGPPPERAGEPATIGRVFAEHVLTRPFAPPSERRVEALPGELSGRSLGARPWVAFEHVGADLPVGPAQVRRHRFSLAHTDSNQHVNSLVYPALFEAEAVALWDRPDAMSRAFDVIWRKPCFAGDRVELRTHRVERPGAGGRFGVLVTLHGLRDDGEPEDAPRCRALLWLG